MKQFASQKANSFAIVLQAQQHETKRVVVRCVHPYNGGVRVRIPVVSCIFGVVSPCCNLPIVQKVLRRSRCYVVYFSDLSYR